MNSFGILLTLSLIIVAESFSCVDHNQPAVNTDTKLKKVLLCQNYDKEIRPGSSKEKTTINFRYTVKSFDYEDNARTLSVTSWMTLAWVDQRLSWLPADYDEIRTIQLNIDYVWSPDIYLYNAHLSSGVGKCEPGVDCLITWEGKVACVMPCEHIGHCTVGVYTNWPFDRQNCSFTFGSWMKTGEELNYNTERVKLISSRAKENNQWKLLSSKSRVNPGIYASAPNETYPSVVFSFLLERHSAFHISGTMIPAIVLLVCNLTLLLMTPHCIERFVLALTNVFSHFIYMEFLYWMLPWCGDSVPNVLVFFRDSHLITGFLLIETIIMSSLAIRSKGQRPYLWLITVVNLSTRNIVGEFLLTSSTAKIENAEDLVESAKTQSSDDVIWMAFFKLIDRILFLVFLILYLIMVVSLLPEGYLKISYDPIENES